jgi:hypothetical protein
MKNAQIWQANQIKSRLGSQIQVPIYTKEAYKLKFKKNRQYDMLGEDIDAFITSQKIDLKVN